MNEYSSRDPPLDKFSIRAVTVTPVFDRKNRLSAITDYRPIYNGCYILTVIYCEVKVPPILPIIGGAIEQSISTYKAHEL